MHERTLRARVSKHAAKIFDYLTLPGFSLSKKVYSLYLNLIAHSFFRTLPFLFLTQISNNDLLGNKIVIHCSTNTSYSSTDILKDSLGIPLSAGSVRNGDGYLVTLGYYDNSDSSSLDNHFEGNWIPLTEGTRIGD